MSVKKMFSGILRKAGYSLSKLDSLANPLTRRKLLMQTYEIDTVLDIGANTGQFARQLRNEIGYKKKIVSFEPLHSAFHLLENNAKNDSYWDVYNFALGDSNRDETINVSANSFSSSLLDMLPSHLSSAPESYYLSKEKITIKKLDSIFHDTVKSNNIYMKIDTQGFESKVLKGSEESIYKIDTIQLEMSLIPLYKDEAIFPELFDLLSSKGYTLVGIENGFTDRESGQTLQIDGIFHRYKK